MNELYSVIFGVVSFWGGIIVGWLILGRSNQKQTTNVCGDCKHFSHKRTLCWDGKFRTTGVGMCLDSKHKTESGPACCDFERKEVVK